jgi:tRNA(adenine34) deaminase
METTDEDWLFRAIHVAREALKYDEVPVGAIVVDSAGKVLSTASNRPITTSDPTAHAEMIALRIAAQCIGNYRLNGATVYTTLEPCAMCAGALVNARVKRLVFGALDERFGAVRTHFNICDSPKLNHRIEVTSGVLADECGKLLKDFFQARRSAGTASLLDKPVLKP